MIEQQLKMNDYVLMQDELVKAVKFVSAFGSLWSKVLFVLQMLSNGTQKQVFSRYDLLSNTISHNRLREQRVQIYCWW